MFWACLRAVSVARWNAVSGVSFRPDCPGVITVILQARARSIICSLVRSKDLAGHERRVVTASRVRLYYTMQSLHVMVALQGELVFDDELQ